MAGSMYACYRIQQIQQPIVFFGKIFNKNQVCIAVNIATIPILHLFGAGSILFWVLGMFCLQIWFMCAYCLR